MNNKNNKKIYFILSAFSIFVLVFLLAPAISNALNVDYPPIPTPGGVLDLNDEVDEGRITMSSVIFFAYSAGLWVAGILAFLALIFAGFAYIVSGANPGQRARAMNRFKNVLWGLGILLVSSVILNIINPQIVTIKDPKALNISPSDEEFLGFSFTFDAKSEPEPIIADNHSSCRWDVGFGGPGGCRQIDRCENGFVPNIICSAFTDDKATCDAAAEENYPCVEEGSEPPPEDPAVAGTFLCTTSTGSTCFAKEPGGASGIECNDGYAPDESVCDALSPTSPDFCGGSDTYPCKKALP